MLRLDARAFDDEESFREHAASAALKKKSGITSNDQSMRRVRVKTAMGERSFF